MKSSQSEPTQQQSPLGNAGKAAAPSPAEIWKPYGPNPNIEINNEGKLRTKPINPAAPDPWKTRQP